MCATCGCSDQWHALDHDHARDLHDHTPGHEDGEHSADASRPRLIELERDVLDRNARLAARVRTWFRHRGILALNLVSSPGAGKTSLLERTIRDMRTEVPILVIEGDQATEHDAERIRAAGARAIQINTGTACHLDAGMVAHALDDLRAPTGSIVVIENVGNLVCPALFDLGEHAKVVVASVPEGDDKPIKYPHMFRASRLMILNKIDLLPLVRFDMRRALGFVREVNPAIDVLMVSATRGDGVEDWYRWLCAQLSALSGPPVAADRLSAEASTPHPRRWSAAR